MGFFYFKPDGSDTVMPIGTVYPCPACTVARSCIMAHEDRAQFLPCAREGSVQDQSGLWSDYLLEFGLQSRPVRSGLGPMNTPRWGDLSCAETCFVLLNHIRQITDTNKMTASIYA